MHFLSPLASVLQRYIIEYANDCQFPFSLSHVIIWETADVAFFSRKKIQGNACRRRGLDNRNMLASFAKESEYGRYVDSSKFLRLSFYLLTLTFKTLTNLIHHCYNSMHIVCHSAICSNIAFCNIFWLLDNKISFIYLYSIKVKYATM